MAPGDLFYAALRLGLAVVGAVSFAVILVLSYKRISHEWRGGFERRLRMISIVGLLALVSVLLAITALYDWDRPAQTDPFLAFMGLFLRAAIALGGVVIIWTWNAE